MDMLASMRILKRERKEKFPYVRGSQKPDSTQEKIKRGEELDDKEWYE